MKLTATKDVFLSNLSNKQRFIEAVGQRLSARGCKVLHDQSDADVLIAKTAIESEASLDTILVGDDIDLLILLIHHAPLDKHDIFFTSERKKNSMNHIWNIKGVKTGLGTFVCKHMLFLHAVLGCDTTSRLFGIGKGSILKKFKEKAKLQKAALIFDNLHSTQAQIDQAGESALVLIYNGKKGDSLNGLRYKKYCEKVATSLSQVDPKLLPPTAAAASFHSKRVFLQINQWKDSECDLLPEEWGWTQSETGLHPIATNQPPAPAELLKIIRCNCTTDCASARCSCQKHGMKCSMACGQCHGTSCSNAAAFAEELEGESESDDE